MAQLRWRVEAVGCAGTGGTVREREGSTPSHRPANGRRRISHAALATKVLLSHSAIRQRVDRRGRHNLIQGYSVVAGPASRGTISVIVMVYRKDRVRGVGVITVLRSRSGQGRCADSGISKSEMSRICAGLEAELAQFGDRTPAAHDFSYVSRRHLLQGIPAVVENLRP